MTDPSSTPRSTCDSNLSACHAPSRGSRSQFRSLLTAPAISQGQTSGAVTLKYVNPWTDDSEDDLQPPPQLSALGRSVLEQQGENEFLEQSKRAPKLRILRDSPSSAPVKEITTPIRTLRIKRVGLQGAPVRRKRRTSQSEEVHELPRHGQSPKQDQENSPALSVWSTAANGTVDQDPGSTIKRNEIGRLSVARHGQEKPVPLAQVSGNAPYRPAPLPAPRVSTLEAATKAAGASTTRKGAAKRIFVVKGKSYVRIEKCGRGGSADVHRVMAENGETFALKRVRLAGVDQVAVAGLREEVEHLQKLQDSNRVVRLYDHLLDSERNYFYMVSLPICSINSLADIN